MMPLPERALSAVLYHYYGKMIEKLEHWRRYKVSDMEDKALYEMACYFGGDTKRICHAFKVYGAACAIASGAQFNQSDRLTLGLAAVLHDIGIRESERKYNSSAAKYQQSEGPPVAREILERLDCDSATIDRVCYLIAHHHTYGAIDGEDFQILIEADFIVNIQEGEFDAKEAAVIREKYFKTDEGKRIVNLLP
jgi:HD superfamily phosphodiesterase